VSQRAMETDHSNGVIGCSCVLSKASLKSAKSLKEAIPNSSVPERCGIAVGFEPHPIVYSPR
jgi:hypothetical protein